MSKEIPCIECGKVHDPAIESIKFPGTIEHLNKCEANRWFTECSYQWNNATIDVRLNEEGLHRFNNSRILLERGLYALINNDYSEVGIVGVIYSMIISISLYHPDPAQAIERALEIMGEQGFERLTSEKEDE